MQKWKNCRHRSIGIIVTECCIGPGCRCPTHIAQHAAAQKKLFPDRGLPSSEGLNIKDTLVCSMCQEWERQPNLFDVLKNILKST